MNNSNPLLRWLPYLVFALATAIFFNSHLFGHAFFWNDFAEYVYPTRVFAAKHISQGHIPFWNPYSFSGTPFMADVQTALFYPPYMLLDYFSGGSAYPINSLQFVIIFHFFVAQISMYLLCRRLNLSLWGAMIAAVAYGFSSPLALHAFHPMQVFHLSWFPLIFRFFHQAITERKLLDGLYCGLLLGVTMLSGSPQMTLYVVFFLGCWLLWYCIDSFRKKERSSKEISFSLGLGALSIIIGVGLFAVQYFPSKEFASLSERNEITIENAATGSLQYKQLITAAVAKAYGQETAPDDEKDNKAFFFGDKDSYLYWDTAFYFGILTLILGIVGIQAKWDTREVKFLVAIAAFGFLFALGSNGFVFKLFFHLPLFNALRAPARMMFFCSFGFCILAAYGFDKLSTVLEEKSALMQLGFAAAIPVLLALGVGVGFLVDAPEEMKSAIHSYGLTSLGIAVTGLVIVFLMHRSMLKPSFAALALVAIIFVDLDMNNGSFNVNHTNPIDDYQSYMTPQLSQMLLPKPPTDIFRVLTRVPGVNALKRNQGLTDGVLMFEGYNQLLVARRHPKARSQKELRDLLAIKNEVVYDSVKNAANFQPRPDYFPNAWLVYQVKQSTPEQAQQAMQDSLQYHDVAVTEEALSLPLSGKPSSQVQHSVVCNDYKDNAITYTATTQENGLMCMSEIWYPSWNAYVDGKKAKVYRINYCLRGVEIPSGTHKVEMCFESESFATGSMISLSTLLLSLGGIGVLQFKKRNRREQ